MAATCVIGNWLNWLNWLNFLPKSLLQRQEETEMLLSSLSYYRQPLTGGARTR